MIHYGKAKVDAALAKSRKRWEWKMTVQPTLRVPSHLMQEINAHAEKHYPEEAVGLLLGISDDAGREVQTVLPLENQFAAEQRGRRYLIEPTDMLEAEQLADQLGLQIIGVFHSHPDHPPQPSQYDLEMAVPWYFYLITSVDQGRADGTQVWRLEDDHTEMTELPLQLAEEEE